MDDELRAIERTCEPCGADCSGDTVQTVVIYDDVVGERPVCDNPNDCPESNNGR